MLVSRGSSEINRQAVLQGSNDHFGPLSGSSNEPAATALEALTFESALATA
jgi:hypothetical protein